ncbi:MAG: aminomethyltransferase, partial [Alphaproteobacteria bacterium]|nr:aminomethyltransferase [Alphaproteobacteria bacterium]
MNAPGRLPLPWGKLVDRNRPIGFTFASQNYFGYAGDTVASALHAAGVRVLARSFKYRRPRGLIAHGEFDAGTLLQMGAEPNLPADRLPLVPDLPPLEPVNVRGTLARDRGVWTDALSRFLPVGFYYRAFLSRPWDWRAMESAVRRMA